MLYINARDRVQRGLLVLAAVGCADEAAAIKVLQAMVGQDTVDATRTGQSVAESFIGSATPDKRT